MMYLIIVCIVTGVIYQLAEASAVTNDLMLRIHFIMTAFLLMLSSILLFYLLDRHMEAEQIRQQAAMDQMQERMQKEFYHVSAKREAQMRGLRHDLQNHLAVVQSHLQRQELVEAKNYLQGLGIEAEKSRSIVTGAASIDVMLNIKKEVMEEAQISFQYEIGRILLRCVDEMDLVVLLANSLDNALEAAEKYTGSVGQRWVHLLLQADEEYVIIQVTNSISTPQRYDSAGHLQTNKTNPVQHGLEMKNIKRIVHGYEGNMEFFEKDKQCTLWLMLPNHLI